VSPASPQAFSDVRLRALVVTSDATPVAAVEPVVLALEAADLCVRLVDVGRGAAARGPLDRVVRAVVGEAGERRLLRALGAQPPEVTLAFDPIGAAALAAARDAERSLAPVIAVVPELTPDQGWAAARADRYLTFDDAAAVALSDDGAAGERILAVGPIASRRFAAAASEARAGLRERFKLRTGGVVLVDVSGFGYESTQTIALQMALGGANMTTLFDAGADRDAATALRRQVPTLDMPAKLFGRTDDAPALWRAADVIVARPTVRAVARALLLGARFVALLPDGPQEERLAEAVVERGVGAIAKTALLLSSTLAEVLAGKGDIREWAGRDGAKNVADISVVVGEDRAGVLDEARAAKRQGERAQVARAAAVRAETAARGEAEARLTAEAGGLEDLSGGSDFGGAGTGPAAGAGSSAGASPRANPQPTVDEMLAELKRRGDVEPDRSRGKKPAGKGRAPGTLDDELAALKRKMGPKKSKKP
jgi:hypothetical protein